MRVPLPWLREYCDPDLDVRQIEERLTMTGTKVEAIHHQGVASTDGFVVGRVLSAERHPDADRLKVCTVDLGEGGGIGNGDGGGEVSGLAGPATIVCGAPNVAAGQTVAVARPGAVMPDGTKLKQAKLRGVVSEGMILSENELEINLGSATPEGIMVLDEATLDAELAPGTPLAEVLAISTDVLELEITPNRPDCLGVYGVARELHAATGAALADAPWSEDPGSTGSVAGAEVLVECPDLCPRFTARVFEDVTVAPSPLWLKARLTAAGQRPINNVVDITNYAMLLSGQPLHAFDLDRVAGARLTVRRAHEGEQVQTLDGQTRTLDAEMVVIEDADGPTSIAGLMGGARSEVQRADAARADGGRHLERPEHPPQLMGAGAAQRGVRALREGAAAGAVHARAGDRDAPDGRAVRRWRGARDDRHRRQTGRRRRVIVLRDARVKAILGVAVARERQAQILGALDFASEPREDGLEVSVPALRRDDVTREVDLIEEVARIDGLERLPATLPARRGAAGRLTHAQRVRREAEDALVGRGLHEIVGWSFADPELLDRLRLGADHELRRVVRIENPMSEGQSIMRPTLLGSLLDAARHNVARNGPDVAIFESGTVYRAAGDAGAGEGAGGSDRRARADERAADEHHGLGVLLSGELEPRSWRGERREADFFAAKALLGSVLDRFHVDWSVTPAVWPFLHPGRSAAVLARAPGGSQERDGSVGSGADGTAGGERQPIRLGFVGELHPLVAETWDIAGAVAFAIDLGKLAALAPPVVAFTAFGPFPALRQDLAVTLPESVSAAEALERVRAAAGRTLDDVRVFDVYTGAQVGEGRRSLALALSFRALDRTLTDEDIEPVRARIVAALQELGGELRG